MPKPGLVCRPLSLQPSSNLQWLTFRAEESFSHPCAVSLHRPDAEPAAAPAAAPTSTTHNWLPKHGSGRHMLPQLGNATTPAWADRPHHHRLQPANSTSSELETRPKKGSLMYLLHYGGGSRGSHQPAPREQEAEPFIHTTAVLRSRDRLSPSLKSPSRPQAGAGAGCSWRASLRRGEETRASPACATGRAVGRSRGEGLPNTCIGTEATKLWLKHSWKNIHKYLLCQTICS